VNVGEALAVLGLDHRPDDAALREAYQRARSRAHPDKNGTAERFRRVQDAYQLLKAAPQGQQGGGAFNAGAFAEAMGRSFRESAFTTDAFAEAMRTMNETMATDREKWIAELRQRRQEVALELHRVRLLLDDNHELSPRERQLFTELYDSLMRHDFTKKQPPPHGRTRFHFHFGGGDTGSNTGNTF